MSRILFLAIGALSMLPNLAEPRRRDERGLSQSTENVILLVGAVAVAAAVIVAVTAFVRDRLLLVVP